MLKYSLANAKTEELKRIEELTETFLANNRKIYSLDLLSGHSCPFAHECFSKAVVKNGKRSIQDGPYTKFRCFSASQEAQYTNVYNSRKNNFQLLRGLHLNDMIAELSDSMPKNLGVCRIHVAGDFFNRDYMFAWINMAMMNPDRLFYAYTKSLKYWVELEDYVDNLDNFVLTASYGGRDDSMIAQHNLRFAKVVFSEAEAEKLGLEIDHDDSHAARPTLKDRNFALLLHGTQPKDTDASEALKVLKRDKVQHSYSREKAAV